MTQEFFKSQVQRLRTRFSERAFDNESVLLIWREVGTMSDMSFARTVDVMIGSRKHTDPPRLTDFREARLRDEKREFDNEVRSAADSMDWPAKGGLARVLARDYPGAKTLNEAVQIQILRNQIARANERKPDGEGA